MGDVSSPIHHVQIAPKDKALIDSVIDVAERERSRRAWRFWLVVAAMSVAAMYLVGYEFFPGLLRIALAAVGGLGFLPFLVFLSTKPLGRNYYAGPSWWIW
jgi:hypothetical protein